MGFGTRTPQVVIEAAEEMQKQQHIQRSLHRRLWTVVVSVLVIASAIVSMAVGALTLLHNLP